MKNEIVRISLNDSNIESIYAVKLDQGDYLYIDTLKFYTQAGLTYFYIDSNGIEREIEIVESTSKNPYLHTKDIEKFYDPILTLARY